MALVIALTEAQFATRTGSARCYVKAKIPSFSGKKKDWLLFKMQLQAYFPTLGLEGVYWKKVLIKNFQEDYILF